MEESHKENYYKEIFDRAVINFKMDRPRDFRFPENVRNNMWSLWKVNVDIQFEKTSKKLKNLETKCEGYLDDLERSESDVKKFLENYLQSFVYCFFDSVEEVLQEAYEKSDPQWMTQQTKDMAMTYWKATRGYSSDLNRLYRKFFLVSPKVRRSILFLDMFASSMHRNSISMKGITVGGVGISSSGNFVEDSDESDGEKADEPPPTITVDENSVETKLPAKQKKSKLSTQETTVSKSSNFVDDWKGSTAELRISLIKWFRSTGKVFERRVLIIWDFFKRALKFVWIIFLFLVIIIALWLWDLGGLFRWLGEFRSKGLEWWSWCATIVSTVVWIGEKLLRWLKIF